MLEFFKNRTGLLARMSLRKYGNMWIRKNRGKFNNPNLTSFFGTLQILEEGVVFPVLEHRNRVTVVTEHTIADLYSDGLVTKLVGKFLSVTAADCFPIFFFDPVNRVIGLAHSGWRPLVEGILLSTVVEMESLGAKKENILAEVGPGICQRHYIWRKEDLYRLKRYKRPEYLLEIIGDRQNVRVLLEEIIKDQLVEAGIYNKHFSMRCTYCDEDSFFSARRGDEERMLAVIGMTD